MFTIVPSSTTINWAMAMKISAFQRRGSGIALSAGAVWDVSDVLDVLDKEVRGMAVPTREGCEGTPDVAGGNWARPGDVRARSYGFGRGCGTRGASALRGVFVAGVGGSGQWVSRPRAP